MPLSRIIRPSTVDTSSGVATHQPVSDQYAAIAVVAQVDDVDRSFLEFDHERMLTVESHVGQPRAAMRVLFVEDDHPPGLPRRDVEFHYLGRAFDCFAEVECGGIKYLQAAVAVGNDAVDVDG